MTPPLQVRDLRVRFPGPAGAVRALDGVGFDLQPGSVLGILGESGSGKSVLLKTLMGILPAGAQVDGSALVGGREVVGAPPRALRRLRGRSIALVFQDPMTGFDPCYRVGEQIAETVAAARRCSGREARRRVGELLELVQVPAPDRCARAYPHELSGGMRQRCMIAMALAGDPDVLLADEPTTALDVSVQMQVLRLLRSIQRGRRMSMVFVTHDIGVLAEVCDEVAVMYAGRFVEQGPLDRVLASPAHPYAAGLLGSTLTLGHRGRRATPIPGDPPPLDRPFPGCAFSPRCAVAEARCEEAPPPVQDVGPGWRVRCVKPFGAVAAALAPPVMGAEGKAVSA